MFTRWYWSPRDSGGDCHHFSVPSIACWIEWFLEATLGSQWSQESPRISNFPATVANLQNNSGSPTSSPHVAVAVIFFPWAMLIAGRLSLCPWPDFGAKLTSRMACRMARAGVFIVETAHTLNNQPHEFAHSTISSHTHAASQHRLLCVEKARKLKLPWAWGKKNSRISRDLQPTNKLMVYREKKTNKSNKQRNHEKLSKTLTVAILLDRSARFASWFSFRRHSSLLAFSRRRFVSVHQECWNSRELTFCCCSRQTKNLIYSFSLYEVKVHHLVK